MKVVIFKSGLGVSVHENANISGTMQDMKFSKVGAFLSHKNFGHDVLTKIAKILTEGQKFL